MSLSTSRKIKAKQFFVYIGVCTIFLWLITSSHINFSYGLYEPDLLKYEIVVYLFWGIFFLPLLRKTIKEIRKSWNRVLRRQTLNGRIFFGLCLVFVAFLSLIGPIGAPWVFAYTQVRLINSILDSSRSQLLSGSILETSYSDSGKSSTCRFKVQFRDDEIKTVVVIGRRRELCPKVDKDKVRMSIAVHEGFLKHPWISNYWLENN